MSFIDLHVHSNASDGTLSPAQVVERAVSKKLSSIALTDHDTVFGIPEALNTSLNTGLEVIPGIELSCMYGDSPAKEIHILGLFVDYQNKEFVRRINYLAKIRNARNEEILRRFRQAGIEITMADLTQGHDNAIITRAHFAKALKEQGYVSTISQAFQKYLSYDGPYCVRKTPVSAEYAMETLASAHAFPIIAHPLAYNMGYMQIETMISYLKGLGLRGVEVYHSSHNQYQSGKLNALAKQYGLLPSGGSDFHGLNKPDIEMGSGRGGLRLTHFLLDDIKKSIAGDDARVYKIRNSLAPLPKYH